MNSRIMLLGGLLITQLVLVLLLNIGGGSTAPSGGLLALEPAVVNELAITDADGNRVTLKKVSQRWQLDSGTLVDQGKVDSVIERLAQMQSLWPVASTESSQTRFEVAPDNFQRLLEIRSDDAEAEIYLGSSPGYRRVHARNSDSDDVFSIEFADYEVPAQAGEWIDQTQLQVDGISALSLQDGWTLSADGDNWLVDDAAADAEAAAAMIRRIEELRAIGVFQGDEATLGPARELQVTAADGDYTLVLRHDPGADEYVVTSSRTPGSFTVASYIAEQVLVTQQALLPAQEAVETQP